MAGLRTILTVALAVAAIAAACTQPAAQSLPYGSIGLYVDENHSSNTAAYAGPFTEFRMYVFCRPGAQGISAVEFAVKYPPNVIPADVTTSPLISVALGDLGSGMSAAFTGCRSDWVWTHYQRLFITSGDETRIEIGEHPVSGALQYATCETGYPLENALISSMICLNSSCPDISVPQLLDAVNISANGVQLTFSEALLESTAENLSNYEITELNDSMVIMPLSEAILLADGSSVRVYTSVPFVEGRTYVIRAHGVLDLWGNEIPPASERTFTVIDRVPPRLLSAHAASDISLTVTFNEAMDPASAMVPGNYRLYFYIDPNFPEGDIPCASYPYAATPVSESSVALSFDLPPMPIQRTLILRVKNVTDIAGNIISSEHNTVEFVVPDPYPPVIASLQMPGSTLLDVRFNEPVRDSTASAAGNYAIFKKEDTLTTVPVTSASLLADQRTARLTLGAPLEFETTYVLRVRGVRDLFGNVIAPPGTFEFKRSDFFPPVPLSAVALSRTLIRIAFNKQLDETSAEIALYYRVFETANEAATIPVASAALEPEGDAVRLSLDAWLPYNTSYTVNITHVSDLSGHAIGSVSITTSYPDTLPPEIIGVTLIGSSAFELLFNDFLDAVSAGEESNYLLYETGNPARIIPISATSVAGNGSRVLLSLAGTFVHGRSYTISASNVADWKGMVIPPGTTYVFTFVDTTAPTLIAAHATSGTAVCAYFSEPLDNVTAENPGNYTIVEKLNKWRTVPVSSAALAGDSSSVQLSLGGALTAGIVYTLRATGIADRASNPVPAGSEVQFSIPDTLPPQIQAVHQESFEVIYVLFDEAVGAPTAGSPANYSLVGITPPPDTTAPSAVACLGNKLVSLSFVPPFTPGRIYALQVRNVIDAAGNVIPPGSEKRFVSSPYPAGGAIGLYIDKNHSTNEVQYAYNGATEFRMYVWCKPGEYGAMGAEFYVPLTGHVYPGATTVNSSVVAVSSGEPFAGMTAGFSQCATDWVWICREQCYLIDSQMSTLDISPAGSDYSPVFMTCAEGSPRERANVISPIKCNYVGIATLLAQFSASYRDGSIDIAWSLSRLDGEARFAVSRAEDEGEEYTPLTDEISGSDLSFLYRDNGVEPGTSYRYRVEFLDGAGVHILFDTEPVAVPPLPLTLYQNWPNPFNPATNVAYYLPGAVNVRLEIFDVAGRRIKCLANGRREKGKYIAAWNGADESGGPVAAGIYICRLTADKKTLSRKMILLK